MAIIEELNSRSCRLRSINEFKVGDLLAFECTLRGAKALHLSGKVLSSALNGQRRSYTVVLHKADEDAIIVALDTAQRFSVAHPIRDVHTDTGLTRASARIPVDLAVDFKVAGGPVKVGNATNVSTGGILLNCTESIPVGSEVEVHFTLPGSSRRLTAKARVVAHQHQSPNYNMAFFHLEPETRTELDTFVKAHTKEN
ncbi:MAG: PilZ domain-containing protein [Candidatus Eremiobacteraeota bacterium]|nr:PilZ domain-containing protein [Candidatus Eremiobacteraeota bacterium]